MTYTKDSRRMGGFPSKLFFLFITLISIILFSIPIVFSTPTWIGWGNVGYNDESVGAGNLMFASNYPDGNINFTTKYLGSGADFTPLIYDFNLDGKNELVIVDGTGVYLYDNNANMISFTSTTEAVCGSPIIKLDLDESEEDVFPRVILVSENASHYMSYVYKITTTGIEQEQKNLFAEKSTYTFDCNIYNVPNSNFVYLISQTSGERGSIYAHNIYINTLVKLSEPNTEIIKVADRSSESTLIGGGMGSSADYDLDGFTEIAVFGKNAGSEQVYAIYKPNTNSWITQPTAFYPSLPANMIGGFAQIGGGVLDLIISSKIGAQWDVHVIDIPSGSVWNMSDGKNGFGGLSGALLSPFVNDIDGDGVNEFCVVEGNNGFSCWEKNFDIVIYKNDTGKSNTWMASGEYSSLYGGYQELITYEGIFEVASSGLIMVYNFSDYFSTNDGVMFLPASLQSVGSYNKDLIAVSSYGAQVFFAYLETSCGDGICEGNETIFTCQADCLYNVTFGLNDTEGNLGYNQGCFDDDDCFGNLTCENNLCTGISGGSLCTQDFECRSGICNSMGFCEDVGFVEGTKDFFFQVGIRSTFDKLLMSMIIVFLFTMCGGSLGNIGGTIGAVVGAVIGFILSLFAMVFAFGWLGIWTIFMLIFVVIVILVTSIMLFSGGGSGGF